MRDAVRLVVGTLTILPVRAPGSVDRRTAGRAMTLAPLVGLLLGGVLMLLVWGMGGGRLPLSADRGLLASAVVLAALALLTRGLHLDGLADTADGLGSGRSGGAALDVMRRSDIGPFGVATLLLVLLVQVAAAQRLVQSPFGLACLVIAIVVSRFVLPLLCSAGVPPARADGLGVTVAGSVSRSALVLSGALATAASALAWAVARWLDPFDVGLAPSRLGVSTLVPNAAVHVALVVVVPLALVALFARRCVRRFGGVTGDVLGACVELSLAAALLVAAL